MLLAEITKQPVEVDHRVARYKDWLCEGEFIKEVQVFPVSLYDDIIVHPPLEIAHTIRADIRAFATILSAFGDVGLVVSNGINGKTYTVNLLVSTSDGRRREDEFQYTIKEV